jgi:hypothetical protein
VAPLFEFFWPNFWAVGNTLNINNFLLIFFFSDIDDCLPNPCWADGACKDQAAPRRGYTCAPCPPPYIGDGVLCSLPVPCPPTVRCYPGAACRAAPGGQVTCAACPAGMEGDGVLCRPLCYPACNAHQKCSVPECYAAKGGGPEAVEDQGLRRPVPAGGEEEEEGEEGAVVMAVRTMDEATGDVATSQCDRPCRLMVLSAQNPLVTSYD